MASGATNAAQAAVDTATKQLTPSTQADDPPSDLLSQEASAATDTGGQWSCRYCAKGYSSQTSLRIHEKWHTGELKEKCNYCTKRFRNPSERKRHEMTHTGERPFQCQHCSCSYIQRTSLLEHVRKKHSEQQPQLQLLQLAEKKLLTCKYCQKEFEDEVLLLQHEEIEAQEFEELHETFEKQEFGELEEFSLPDYLGHTDPNSSENSDLDYLEPSSGGSSSNYNSCGNDYISHNGSSGCITVDSEELLAAEQQLLANAQEEAAWSLVSMGRSSIARRSMPANPSSLTADVSNSLTTSLTTSIIPKVEELAIKQEVGDPKLLPVDNQQRDQIKIKMEGDNKIEEIANFFKGLEHKYPHLKLAIPACILNPAGSIQSSLIQPRSTTTPVDTIQAAQQSQSTPPPPPPVRPSEQQSKYPQPPAAHQSLPMTHGTKAPMLGLVVRQAPPPAAHHQPRVYQQRAAATLAASTAENSSLGNNSVLFKQLHQQRRETVATGTPTSKPTAVIIESRNMAASAPVIVRRQQPHGHALLPTPPLSSSGDVIRAGEASSTGIVGGGSGSVRVALATRSVPLDSSVTAARTVESSVGRVSAGQRIALRLTSIVNSTRGEPSVSRSLVAVPNSDDPVLSPSRGSDVRNQRAQSLSCSDDLNAFCEGILSQIDSSTTWPEFNMNEFQVVTTAATAQDSVEYHTVALQPTLPPANPALRGPVAIKSVAPLPAVSPSAAAVLPSASSPSTAVGTAYWGPAASPVLSKPGLSLGASASNSGQRSIAAGAEPPDGGWLSGRMNLPNGWKMRIIEDNSSRDNSVNSKPNSSHGVIRRSWSTQFQSPDGVILHSRREAVDHLISTGGAQEDIDRLRRGLDTARPARSSGVKEDQRFSPGQQAGSDLLLPANWRKKEKLCADKKVRTYYISPSGQTFPSRLAAYQHMLRAGGFSREELELMRHGALYKPSDNSTNNRSSAFNSCSNNSSAIINNGISKNSNSCIESFEMGSSGSGNNRSKLKEGLEQDSTLPLGWLVKKNAFGRETFRDPEGKFFPSRQTVVQHMVENNFPDHQVELARAKLTSKKKMQRTTSGSSRAANRSDPVWIEDDPSLPVNWKMREVQCSDGNVVYIFLAPDGTTLRGRKAALSHMLRTGLYTTADIQLMEAHQNILSRVSDNWQADDPTLPRGWKIRRYIGRSDNKRVRCEYLSPQHRVFRSRKAVIEHMQQSGGYSHEDFLRMDSGVGGGGTAAARSSLHSPPSLSPRPPSPEEEEEEPWTEADFLPPGWKEKMERSPPTTTFMCPEGNIYFTVAEVVTVLELSGRYSGLELGRLQKRLEDKQAAASAVLHPRPAPPSQPAKRPADKSSVSSHKMGRRENPPNHQDKKGNKPAKQPLGWKACSSTLPFGWRMRTTYLSDRTKCTYLSPSGKIFTSLRAIIAHLEATDAAADAARLRRSMAMAAKRKRKGRSSWALRPTRRHRRNKNPQSEQLGSGAAEAAAAVPSCPSELKVAVVPLLESRVDYSMVREDGNRAASSGEADPTSITKICLMNGASGVIVEPVLDLIQTDAEHDLGEDGLSPAKPTLDGRDRGRTTFVVAASSSVVIDEMVPELEA